MRGTAEPRISVRDNSDASCEPKQGDPFCELFMTLDDSYLSFSFELAGRIVDPLAGVIEYKGRKRPARRKQLEVLALLASAEGKVVARRTFIEVVWENNALVGDTGLTDTVSDLRQTLDDSDRDHPLIRTIPRRGYQLSTTARRLEAAKPVAFEAGAEIPGALGWRLQRLLSSNAVSETWLATGPDSALRVFRFCRDEQHLRLLRREATLLRYLQQALGERADIAHITTWQLDEPPYFLELEHFPLGALSSYAETIGGIGNIASAERLRWMSAIAAALAAVHDAGVVHRNVSADSIFLVKDDGQLQPRLGEFGFGELPDRSRLGAITSVGLTLPGHLALQQSVHLAPERVRGEEATAASDVYAFGVLLQQTACGNLAHPAAGWELAIDDASLRDLIAACLDPEPAQRPTAAVVVERLRDLTSSQASVVPTQEAQASLAPPLPSAGNTDRIEARPDVQLEVKAGQTIGPYRVVEKLGQGGMGVVYLAEQREPVQRQVALKVILAGMDTMDVLARFEGERQALALMNHVNVAAVYEAGSSATGRPFFAMEFVPGLEITAHCDERELDFRQRIELFLQVCDGVLHAHQKGIIHRDLKPSNILIKSAQGQPATAKIIDFGVAKSLQRKLGRLTAHTQIGSFVGTPSYSSPEQIGGHSAAVDTRSDIYSLGVMLYELLAGVTPYSEDVLAAQSPVELTKRLRNPVPPLLKRFTSLEANAEEQIAERRKMTVAQMKQTLGSDLSWIVGKCLEHDPNERYPSVLELEKDLRRWLDSRPVEARPISWRYRLRKLVRRHRTTVWLGSAAVAVLTMAVSAAIVSFIRAESALEQARIAAEEATRAADFQVRQLQAIEPSEMGLALRNSLLKALPSDSGSGATEGRTRTIKDWLNSVNFTDAAIDQLDAQYFQPSLQAIEREFAAYPLLQARLWQSLAVGLTNLGQYERAAKVLTPALARRAELLGADHPETLDALRVRGTIYLHLGQYAHGEADLRAAQSGLLNRLGADDPMVLDAQHELGTLLWRKEDGGAEEAVRLLSGVVTARRALYGAEDRRTLVSMDSLSSAYEFSGRLAEAEPLARQVVAAKRRTLGSEHPMTLAAMSGYASILSELGQFELAESIGQDVLDGAKRHFGSRHPHTATAASNLALIKAQRGNLDDAIALQRETLAISLEVQGAQHIETVKTQVHLGNWLRLQGKLVEAKQLLMTALDVLRSTIGDEHPYTLETIHDLALVLKDSGEWSAAESLLREAIARRERLLGAAHADSMSSKKALAEVESAQRR